MCTEEHFFFHTKSLLSFLSSVFVNKAKIFIEKVLQLLSSQSLFLQPSKDKFYSKKPCTKPRDMLYINSEKKYSNVWTSHSIGLLISKTGALKPTVMLTSYVNVFV